VGNYCTHFGAPLGSLGVLFDDRVICPWHAAAFSIVTGAPDGSPALDGLPRYEISEENDDHGHSRYYVQIPHELLKKSTQHMSKRDPKNKTRFVIIGGGAAGYYCAETLRQSQFTGEIVVLSAEDVLPYDRTLLTKVLATGDATKFGLRNEEFFKNVDIEYRLRTTVKHVDARAKKVTLQNGDHLAYDKLCIATGGTAILPRLQGADLKGVFVVRNHNDQSDIKKHAADAKSIVVIGASFIGSESASALKLQFKEKTEVHLVDNQEHPLQRVLGSEIGARVGKQHTDNGVVLHMKQRVTSIKGGANGEVVGVVLSDGTEIKADLVIVGAGITPNTNFLKDSSVELDSKGGIVCDPFL
jgi:NAD(P)H-nitrite reductase large subunit